MTRNGRCATPSPTDALSSTGSSRDVRRFLLLLIAGVIATLLILTPAPASRRDGK